MRRFPLIVFSETVFEICGHSHVALSLRRKTLNKIHVIHWPAFAEASEGILPAQRIISDPAKRVSLKQDETTARTIESGSNVWQDTRTKTRSSKYIRHS